MMSLRKFIIFISILSSLFNAAHAAVSPNKAFRTFWHPTFQGARLDYCSVDGKECGKAVANRYCQILGYDYASQNIIAYNIGLTHYLTTRVQCTGWRCNGFMSISCARNLSLAPKPYHYQQKEFTHPRYNEFRVDWCYQRNQGCGAKAANSFCSRMGYLAAQRFVRESNVGATKAVGTEELCFGTQCKAFQTIVCER